MNFFYRAFLNVKGKKGRTILLILVLSAILLFVLAGIIIQNAATTAVNNAKKSSGATVTLSANRSNAFKKLRQQKSKNPTLSLASVSVKTAKKIGNSDYVKAYNITNSTSVNAKSFDAIKTSSSSQSNQMSGPGGKSSSSSSSQGDISLSGVTSTSQVSSFTSGTSKIKSGRGINASDAGTNNVVIETELAKQNSISVGDTITVKDTDKNIHKFKVVGIYKSSSTSSQTGGMGQTDPSNTIYSSYALVNSIKGTTSAESVTYTISNPSKAAAFITAAKKSINTSKLSLTKDDSTYRSLLTPLNNVKSFAQKIVILVSVAGTIILTLIVVLMIRERRYEIGVLLSLGEKRWKVIAQFFAEMVMIMVVSIAVAGAGGKFVGDAVGKQLVNQTTTTTSTTTNTTTGNSQNGQPGGGGAQMANNGGGGQQQSTQASSQQLQKLSTSISVVSLVQLGAFGLAIILLAILIGSIGILRLQPKKILIS
ncbi:ABC transporter permease [Liquorilactobacillus satsumensis]|uniref:ABC superfamily ATP binding cassette transporter, membrane protein n=1 Tax=Liquorilactobacillus satsumensis DSM 16230 = JCM 12392 TaxID=1423801 RepID=A0A0R1UYT2_9LACO|nr:ABC transporter permease [Liquorilactobacillus satsumensis]KRL98492.1 ABC superfamily ATP binding cassette transporter, membrane protein [Liquorilactobacillus satsumensis DSM 16230 = JCM 12392]